MKFSISEHISRDDALNYFRTDGKDIPRYSEWHHFNFNDHKNGLYGILNLALSGDISLPHEGRAVVSLVVYEKGNKWHGTMDLQPVENVTFEPGSVDLNIGIHHVHFRKNIYHISSKLKDESVLLNARFIPQVRGIRITNIGGMINTFIMPSMKVEGSLQINGLEYGIDGASGYHDHNWGSWNWGKDVGWDWGYLIQPPPPGKSRHEPVTIVFGQVTDSARQVAKSDLVLMVWEGSECKQIFLGDALQVTTEGLLTGVEIRRVPGLMALLYPGQPQEIPAGLTVNARDNDDYLEIYLNVESAIQFMIPHPTNTGKTVINELAGKYNIRGKIGRRSLNFSYFGFAEITG